MELKGKSAEKMPKAKKAAAKKTLKTMTKVRQTDDQYLREVTKKKIEWAEAEKKKGLQMVANHEQAIATLRQQIARLDGAITALVELRDAPGKHQVEKEVK